MSTEVIQAAIPNDSADVARKRVRTTVLVVFVLRLVYEMWFKILDLGYGYGSGWAGLPLWALGIGPLFALYFIVWRRLADPTSRITIGVALGLGASEAYLRLIPLLQSGRAAALSSWMTPLVVLAVAHAVLAMMAILCIRTLKDGWAAVALGALLGWYFFTARMIYETSVLGRLMMWISR
jgi:hypothetical protein